MEGLRRKYRTLILFLLFFNFLPGQNSKTFNELYSKTFLETAKTDLPKAIFVADSLYKISKSDHFRAKCLLLSATLYEQQGDIPKAVQFALRAEELANDSNDPTWRARIYGFLASQYRRMNLFSLYRVYLEKMEAELGQIKDETFANSALGMLMQQNAYFELSKKDYQNSINYITQSQNYLQRGNREKEYFIGNNELLLGINYTKLKKYEEAKKHYYRALNHVTKFQDNHVKAFSYNGLAEVALEENNLTLAKNYLDLASEIAKQSKYINLEIDINRNYQKYYLLKKDLNKLSALKVRQDSITENLTERSAQLLDDTYIRLEDRKTKVQKNNRSLGLIVIFSCFIFILVYMVLMLNRRFLVQKIKIIQNNSIEEPMINGSKKVQVLVSENVEETDKDNESANMMTTATEQKLLAKLEKFEQTKIFTRNTISLSYVATYCNTNTKYLSHIINTYKGKDFNNYINDLRINYILDKLNTHPQYLNFKISALAAEAGFSSQSKFALAFKKVMEVSPSIYIKSLKE